MQHLIETRFSLAMGPSASVPPPAWQRTRLELFRRFCLPSIASQTTEDFMWLVLCDESTDGAVMAELRAHAHDISVLRLGITSMAVPREVAVGDAIEPDVDVLVTTRLDSDDAIAQHYVEAVQSYARAFHRSNHRDVLINFPRGYRFDMRSGTLYGSRIPISSFHSLFERPRHAPARTVFHGGHDTLHEQHLTHQDESMSGWLQVVHGGNIRNRISPLDWALPRGALRGFDLSDGALEPARG